MPDLMLVTRGMSMRKGETLPFSSLLSDGIILIQYKPKRPTHKLVSRRNKFLLLDSSEKT